MSMRKTTHYNFIFDAERWKTTLLALPEGEMTALKDLIGMSEGGWWHWLNPGRSKTYEHPGMLNFLKVCNILNLDPRDFFCLDVEE